MSDLFVRLARSTRLALFETDYEEWQYASHGGTVFVVSYENKPYGVTARHIAKDFPWTRLCITNEKTGTQIAGLKALSYASDLRKAARDTDIGDIAVIEFSDDIGVEFFGEDYFPLDTSTVVGSQAGDELTVYGALKEGLSIEDRTIRPTFAKLDFDDDGPRKYDPFLRTCSALWKSVGFSSIVGISGSPVFNNSRQGLAGVMLRGGVDEIGQAKGTYLDFDDVVRILMTINAGASSADYVKVVEQTRRR
jgi:hypothetical protein